MQLQIPTDRFVGGNIAFFTFATRGFAPFVRNLHASIEQFDPCLADRLIVFCADDDTAADLRPWGVTAVTVDSVGLPEFAEFAGAGFGRVVSYKFALARELLRVADHAWWIDGDIVVQGALGERIRALIADSDADLLMQHELPKDVLNTGFWIARRSPAVERMLADMTAQTAQADVEDQAYFNERHAAAGELSIQTFDPDEFMCGNRFLYQPSPGRSRALILHFNYSAGKDAKRALMMEHGAWHLDQSRWAVRRARWRSAVIRVGLRGGVWLANGDVGMDIVDGITGPRRRSLSATRELRRRIARRRLREHLG
jgi:hypothetical protein